jgi:hypothetical protein
MYCSTTLEKVCRKKSLFFVVVDIVSASWHRPSPYRSQREKIKRGCNYDNSILAYAAKGEGANATVNTGRTHALPLKTEYTAITREKEKGAIWESTGIASISR